jgi:hypothetical protein
MESGRVCARACRVSSLAEIFKPLPKRDLECGSAGVNCVERVVGMVVAEVSFGKREFSRTRGMKFMREIADGFMKLLALVLATIILAVSLAAVSQLFG